MCISRVYLLIRLLSPSEKKVRYDKAIHAVSLVVVNIQSRSTIVYVNKWNNRRVVKKKITRRGKGNNGERKKGECPPSHDH